jgi:hypothetical protein
MLAGVKDGHGRPLYTPQQIQAQLEESQVCPINTTTGPSAKPEENVLWKRRHWDAAVTYRNARQLFDYER